MSTRPTLGASGAQYAQVGVQTGGSVAALLAPAAAVPIIGAAVLAVGVGLALIFGRKGPKQKIEASKIADQVEQQLIANLSAYMNGPRTRSNQAAALANFDYAWQQVCAMWNDPGLGDPGKTAIKDRQAGSCKWQKNGQCWNWFTGYRDPIANDPNVIDDTQAALEQASAAVSGIPGIAWAAAGLTLLGVLL